MCVEPEPVEETLTDLDACQPQGRRNAQHLMAGTTEAPPALPDGSFPETPSPTNAGTPSARRRRKWLLPILIALIILTIIASAGTLFFQTREQAATEQVSKTAIAQYPGYLAGKGRLSFFDPLSQEGGSEWSSSSINKTGSACQFIGGAYHVS